MRLWHHELLEYLPKSQLIAQKRECDLMLKDYDEGERTNHILIKYAWEYPIEHLYSYYVMLCSEFNKRGIKFNSKIDIDDISIIIGTPFPNHQNDRYLAQCFYNLQEKFDRGQRDFSREEYDRLNKFIEDRLW